MMMPDQPTRLFYELAISYDYYMRTASPRK